MKSTDVLREDHKHLLRALNILMEIAAHAERDQSADPKALKTLLEFLEGFGDRHHQGKEESVLFTALLRDQEQKNYQKLCALTFEHNRERSLVIGLQDSVLTKNSRDFVYYAKRLNDTLRAHIKEEEEVLFPLVESTLSPAEDERVLREMKSFDTAWQEAQLSSQLRSLADMESKYLSKTICP
jgi:hemerythrin-like domain-containing protein